MYGADLIDVPIEVFGGYCPAIPPSDLPPGAAVVAQDVSFPQGGVRSRGGLRTAFAGQAASINGIKSFVTSALAKRMMVWDSLGNLYKENPQGTLNLLYSRPYKNLFYQSQTIFGREYQAYFNAIGGADIPRQYDDTYWDRVSQCGPGASPTVVDAKLSIPIFAAPNGAVQSVSGVAIAASPGGISTADAHASGPPNYGVYFTSLIINTSTAHGLAVGQSAVLAGTSSVNLGAGYYNGSYTVTAVLSATSFKVSFYSSDSDHGGGGTLGGTLTTIQTTVAHGLSVGQMAVVAGVAVTGYNGTWTVVSVPDSTHFTFNCTTSGLAASGGGSLATGGHIVAGLHQVSVAFITRQGFITAAAPPSSWTAAGNLGALLSNIPTGPANIVGRLLIFTPVITAPATTGSFYSLPNGSPQIALSTMVINDNVSTSATVDFLDSVLIAGFQANYLFTQLELGESAFTIPYNSRLMWLGERAKVSNFNNLTFDGGFGGVSNRTPLGWTLDPAALNTSGSCIAGNLGVDWGDAYFIQGDGAQAVRGRIFQSAYQDYLGVPIIARNTSYSVRARIAANVISQGTLHINLQSTLGGILTTGLVVTAAQAAVGGAQYIEFSAPLTDVPLATPPSDLILQLYADGTPTNGGQFLIDSIEVFATNIPYNYSTARFSHAFNPESYDSTTGAIQVRPGDGQQLRAGFPLRNNLYIAKDHYLCSVADDGINEPSSWAVNEVSSTIGICGPNAVDWNEEWAVFAERAGLHICWGSDPVKISPEIQNDASLTGQISWQSINWSAGHTMWVRIDKVNKMILVGAPVNGATTPNIVFMLDYRWLDGAQDIAASPFVTYSSFTGKILGHGRGRRWALWNITSNSMAFCERADGSVQPFYGNGAANGKVYQQIEPPGQITDDGIAIPWSYQPYGAPSTMEEQQFQLGAHRKLLGYLKFRAIGAGLLPLAISTTLRSTILRSYTLSTSPAGDGERPINLQGERFYFTIRANASTTAWFQLERLTLCIRRAATMVVRGVSA